MVMVGLRIYDILAGRVKILTGEENMHIIARCACGFQWSTSQGVRRVTVSLVQPAYIPPCPACGKREKQTITITQEPGDEGTLEIAETGGGTGEATIC
jgi:hypothetical protein